jgi:hypothetical protein
MEAVSDTFKYGQVKRRQFLQFAGATVLVGGGLIYLLTDMNGFIREDISQVPSKPTPLRPDEKAILYLASLAPSGHNTQPWFVKYVEPYHWVVGNDKNKWLPAVDPAQRETILSIGAFIQNLEYAADHFGYRCQWNLLARSNQDENIMEVRLLRKQPASRFDVSIIQQRRTVRSNYRCDILRKEHLTSLTAGEEECLHYLPRGAKAFQLLNEQTIEANRQQIYRDAAEEELGDWIRFSNKEARRHCDGLTPASMEIEGVAGWVVRNFYNKPSVMKESFREQGVDSVKNQIARSAGWLIMTSKDSSTAMLLETGKRLQRLLLQIREKGIAIHPMTQVLEENRFSQNVNSELGIPEQIQFILRCGYINHYPDPVSLRRPVEWFLRS